MHHRSIYRCGLMVLNLPRTSFVQRFASSTTGVAKAPLSLKLAPLASKDPTTSETTTKNAAEPTPKAGHVAKDLSDTGGTPLPAVMENNIQKSSSVQELLNISTIPTLLLKHACFILLRLGQLSSLDKSITYDSLMQDERFLRMCTLIQLGDYSHSPQLLFSAIHGLEKLGALESTEIYQTMSIELKWTLRRCQVRYLARAISLTAPSLGYKKSKPSPSINYQGKTDILELAILTLQRRWVEVASGSDFISVFRIAQFLDTETLAKLEDRAVELVQVFTPSEIRQIFVTLAVQKRRPTPLLRALSFHFAKGSDSTNAKDLIELVYALNELTFGDKVLMEKIFNNLCPEIPSPSVGNPALISSLVTSLGQMRYKHKGLLHIVDEWLMANLSRLRPFDYAAWLLTNAVLNYQSSNTKEFCTKAKQVLSSKTSSSPMEWVNIVHSFLVLNNYSNDLLASALSPEAIVSIDKLGTKSSKTKIKLLNINAVANNLAKKGGYKGPLLKEDLVSNWASELKTSDGKLFTVTLETLSSFLPPEKYLTLDKKLSCGVFVDAICLLNTKLEPIPTTDAGKNKAKTIPVAIVVEGYQSHTLGYTDATGQTMLNRRLLENEGFSVLSVPYTEFSSSEKLIRRVQYLEQKLKSIGKRSG